MAGSQGGTHRDLGIRAPRIFIEGEGGDRLQHFKRQSLLCIRRANVESKTPQGRVTSLVESRWGEEQHVPRAGESYLAILFSFIFLTGVSLHADLLFSEDIP